MNLVQRGSQTAKDGFKNEQDICDKFNHWQFDAEAKQWLKIMQYNLNDIDYVKAVILHGYKADINLQIQIKLKPAINTENIQVKLVSNKRGFNQVDKRCLLHYKEMWNIPDDVFSLLQYYTGEKLPYKDNVRDSRRMFIDEFSKEEQDILLRWFSTNKTLVLTDIIKGRGKFSVEWVLVAHKFEEDTRWILS